jgi:hypothetical protein
MKLKLLDLLMKKSTDFQFHTKLNNTYNNT